jgi:hypothetical protein
MATIGASFNPSAFHKDWPIIIAGQRQNAILLPVRLRYDSGGYMPGQFLARNTVDGYYQKYNDSGSSGINTASAILFDQHPVEDFDGTASTDTCMGVGIFGGGVLLYSDRLVGGDANGIADLGLKQITDATGVVTYKF